MEGPDGSGTTYHSKNLLKKLQECGIDVISTSEPTDGGIGKEIRTLLHSPKLPSPDAVQLLFCADRADHVANLIQPALNEGKTVISDRYSLSTIIYGKALGLDEQWLKEINSRFPPPDLTIVTLPPFEICERRRGRRDVLDQFEESSFQKDVYNYYSEIDDPATIFIDTSASQEEVSENIWSSVQKYFGPISRKMIADL